MSAAPAAASNTTESTNDFDSANPIVKTPNAITARMNVRPIRRPGGRNAMNPDIRTAPMAGAARRAPRPRGPTCRISPAKIGKIATAPPNSTATRSSVIAPRKIGRVNRKARPSRTLATSGACARAEGGRAGTRMRATVTSDAAISAAAIAYDRVGPTHT